MLWKISGINSKYKSKATYADVNSVVHPILITKEGNKSVENSVERMDVDDVNEIQSETDSIEEETAQEHYSGDDSDVDGSKKYAAPRLFNQVWLNDFVRDFGLDKGRAELAASRLKKDNLLAPGTKVTVYRTWEKELLSFFQRCGSLIYCCNIEGLMNLMKINVYKRD